VQTRSLLGAITMDGSFDQPPYEAGTRYRMLLGLSSGLVLALAIIAPAVRAPSTADSLHAPPAFDAPEDKVVYLIPMGHLEEHDLEFLATGLEARLGVGVALLPPQATPAWAFQPDRGQYAASGIIDVLFVNYPPDAWRVLAVTTADITTDDVDMVYGYASSKDHLAVLSTARFRNDLASDAPHRRARAQDQLIRAAVHELAHTCDLPHCDHRGCLMAAITDRDQITSATALCPTCAQTLASRLAAPRDPAADGTDRADGLLARGYNLDALDLYLLHPPADTAAPRQLAAWDNRVGAALLSLELVAEGERLLRRAVAVDPAFAPAHYNLALVEAYAGNTDLAVDSLRTGAAVDPDPINRHGFAARFFLDALADPGSALIAYRAFQDAGGADPYLDQRLGPLDRPDIFVFSTDEAEVIKGRARKRRKKDL